MGGFYLVATEAPVLGQMPVIQYTNICAMFRQLFCFLLTIFSAIFLNEKVSFTIAGKIWWRMMAGLSRGG